MIEAYKKYWTNYANFNSRTSRKDFWLTVVSNAIISSVLLLIVSMVFGYQIVNDGAGSVSMQATGLGGLIYSIWGLANLIPGLAMNVRRMHDINKSGWYLLLNCIPFVGSIIYLVYLCKSSVNENNKYGA